ncbi:MAG: hypothetical protein K6E81_03200 [Lachnospiraceae bacterium]|jgi:hypothetical protein|nr:hypothetical protein [Lachnospiraceae bacterium]MCR5425817.1 hypothetical protein [Lachnospiraceae bacterium]
MINFEEELKKFNPSLEIGEVQDAVYHLDLTDATDMLMQMLKEQGEAIVGENPDQNY